MRYVFLLLLCVALPAVSQTFNSGSNGSDGALNLITPGTIVFDPKSFSPALDADGDGIYHFTTINIGAGVTVKLRGDIINGPVVWLAQGTVQINGTVDANGQNGFAASSTTQRTLTIPGAGGYAGGYPAIGPNPAGPGLGPAGGAVNGCDFGNQARYGGFAGTQFLVPLIGGSGGGGKSAYAGGAGGGAVLVASSASISGSGSISARGGDNSGTNPYSGRGAGGAIRLVAPTVNISGLLDARGGIGGPDTQCFSTVGTFNGIVRIEAFQIGAITAAGALYTATPYGLYLSSVGIPALRVISIGGVPVATSPTGTFAIPDITVNSSSPLPVAIEASNVPVGTVVTLTIFSENGPDQSIQSTPLAGTLASSTATANVTLPSGFSKGFVKASFTQQ